MDAEPKPGGDDASQSSQSETNFAARLSAEQSEMLGKFLLAPVPRVEIAPEIRRAAIKDFDWVMMLYGVLFLAAGLVLLIFVALSARVQNEWKLDRRHREVTGVITSVDVTRQTQRRATVYRYDYAFEFIPDGSTGMTQGHYSTTDRNENAAKWHAGDKVQIWYLPDNAAVARIANNYSDFAGLVVLVLMMCGSGCVFWWILIRSRVRLMWLLANGSVGEFRVLNVVWVSGGKGSRSRIRMECARTDDKADNALYCGALFHKDMKFAQSLKDSGRTVFGLYDPRERGKNFRRVEIPEKWFW